MDQPYRRCVQLLLVHGAVLTANVSIEAFSLMRAVVLDLAARALVPAAADAAAAQAMLESRMSGASPIE